MSSNLTPTAHAVLAHLRDHPATAAELREATGRGRSTIDKTLADLAKTGHITKTTTDGTDGETGDNNGPTVWALTDTTPDARLDDTTDGTTDADPGTGTHVGNALDDSDAAATTSGDDAQAPAIPDEPVPDEPDPSEASTEDGVQHDSAGNGGDGGTPPGDTGDSGNTASADDTGNGEDDQDTADTPPDTQVKVCRGCGQQMPRVCPTCAAKTTSYCGTCRPTRPTRRRVPGEPQVLANGLPKLTPGELQRLVADVLHAQPLPDHLGITGWTPGRVAIFLPGRSTGAIANALDKLTTTGQAQLLGDNPKRYQPTPTEEPTKDQPGDAPREQHDGHGEQHDGPGEQHDDNPTPDSAEPPQ